MVNSFRKCMIVFLCAVLLFPAFTAVVNADSDTNQKIPNLDLNFDLTIPATIDNGNVADFMEYFSGIVGRDIKLPATVSGSVYDAVYGLDLNNNNDNDQDNLGDIVNVPELRSMSWNDLRYAYKEAAVYTYVTDNRTVDYTINKYDFEIYERILWAMDHVVLAPEVVQNAQRAINYIISSEYKIVLASMDDARNQEKYSPTTVGQRRLRQAEVHWGNAMDQLAKGNTRPAMNAFQHANFRAQQVLALHGIEYTLEMMNQDSDGDGLPDMMENDYLTDSNNPDTDGDGLPDLYEVASTNTDPLKPDTDENSVRDGQEDFDEDQLNNLQEYNAGTNPLDADTDHDGLKDYEELNGYGTLPAKYDTDEDTVGDGREIELGLNPLHQDSDGDGVLDKDELFSQPIPLKPQALSSFETIGLVPELTIYGVPVEKHYVQIRDAHNIWKQLDHTYGIIGHAVDIETDSPFQSATISFNYNEFVLQGTRPENLKVLWYDEENDRYVVMTNQTLDRTNSKISVETNHFSKYLVVDWSKWVEGFSATFDPGRPTSIRGKINEIILATAYSDRNQGYLNNGAASFTDLQQVHTSGILSGSAATGQQLMGINSASYLQDAIDELSELDSSKWKALMLPVDRETSISSIDINSVLEKAQQNHIKIFPVNTGEATNPSFLSKLADETYSESFDMKFDTEANAVSILSGIYEQIKKEEDADSDGIPDSVETRGMRIADGSIVKTSVSLEDTNHDGIPDGRDSDGDGLFDGYEMGYTERNGNPLPAAKISLMNMGVSSDNSFKAILNKEVKIASALANEDYIDTYSNPWAEDSDQDGYMDQVDADPKDPYVSPIFLLHGNRSNVGSVFGAYNKLVDKDKEHLNDNEDSLNEQYSDYEKQRVKASDDGSFYNTLMQKYDETDIFLFNYANNGDYYLTAEAFNRYLNNLFNMGLIKSPVIGGVPEITIIAHSMGGLVSRSYIELSKDPRSTVFHDPKVKVKKLITMATPHWGGAHLAYGGAMFSPWSKSIPMLNPNHCIYEGCLKLDEDGNYSRDEDYYRGLSFESNINSQENHTEYYAFIGGAIGNIYNPAERFKKYIIPAFSWSPKTGSDYEPQALDYANNHVSEYYGDSGVTVNLDGSDGWVTINSGLGYKWKVFTSNLEINMEYKLIMFGPGNDKKRQSENVDHSEIYINSKVIDLIQSVLSLH